MGRSQRNKRLFGEEHPENAKGSSKVGRKIRKLKEEGKSQEEAVAIALSMKERGEL